MSGLHWDFPSATLTVPLTVQWLGSDVARPCNTPQRGAWQINATDNDLLLQCIVHIAIGKWNTKRYWKGTLATKRDEKSEGGVGVPEGVRARRKGGRGDKRRGIQPE